MFLWENSDRLIQSSIHCIWWACLFGWKAITVPILSSQSPVFLIHEERHMYQMPSLNGRMLGAMRSCTSLLSDLYWYHATAMLVNERWWKDLLLSIWNTISVRSRHERGQRSKLSTLRCIGELPVECLCSCSTSSALTTAKLAAILDFLSTSSRTGFLVSFSKLGGSRPDDCAIVLSAWSCFFVRSLSRWARGPGSESVWCWLASLLGFCQRNEVPGYPVTL